MRWVLILLLAAMAGCASLDAIEEGTGERRLPMSELLKGDDWAFSLDNREWILGSNAVDGKSRLREYMLKGERIEKWTELVSSYTEDPGRELVMAEFMAILKKSMETDCPTLVWNVISGENTDDIVFEWRHKGCQGFPAQHEIKRISKQGGFFFSLSYVKKTQQLTEQERADWLRRLSTASVRAQDGDLPWLEGAGAADVVEKKGGDS